MPLIDAFASAPWYVDHIAPIWRALPPEDRGWLYVSHLAAPAAAGLPNVKASRLTGDVRPILVVSFGDLRMASMVGRSYIALGQHGAGQSYSTDHPAYPGGRSQDKASMFLVPNEHAAARTRRTYPHAAVALVGCPKLDTLPRKERADEPVVAFSFHWSGPSIAPEMRSAWEHYRGAIAPVSAHRKVIGHGHPRSIAMIRPWYRRAGVEIVQGFGDVLRQADLYVCDNSSSLFEFAATGRPVVVLNTPEYRRDVNHGLRFWDAASVGVNCDRPRDLDDAIGQALADAPKQQAARERALDIVYSPRSGGAQLAADALVEWAARFSTAPARPSPRRDAVNRPRGFRSVRATRPIA